MKRTGLAAAKFEAARIAIRNHYGVSRPITDAEVLAEIENLKRKGPANWDDVNDRPLAARLQGMGFVLEETQAVIEKRCAT
jgi:hypothetical protein